MITWRGLTCRESGTANAEAGGRVPGLLDFEANPARRCQLCRKLPGFLMDFSRSGLFDIDTTL